MGRVGARVMRGWGRYGAACVLAGAGILAAGTAQAQYCEAFFDPGTPASPANAYELSLYDSIFQFVGTAAAQAESIVMFLPDEWGGPATEAPVMLRVSLHLHDDLEVHILALEVEAPPAALPVEGGYQWLVQIAHDQDVPAYLRFFSGEAELGNIAVTPGLFDENARVIGFAEETAQMVHAALEEANDLRVDLFIGDTTYSTLHFDGAAYADYYQNTILAEIDELLFDEFLGFCDYW